MPDDRKPPRRHLQAVADEPADRARAHDQRQRIRCHREDDTVPLGRPPGVPNTLVADTTRSLTALFGDECSPYVGPDGDRVHVALTLTAAMVERLVAIAEERRRG